MNRLSFALSCLLLLALAGAPSAFDFSSLGSGICAQLFSPPPSSGLQALTTASSYNSLITASVLIVVAVMMMLGIAYAFGTAFGIQSLKNFTKTEVVESLFNIFVIACIAGSLVLVYGISGFFTNISQLAASNPSTASAPPTSSLLPALCINYMSSGVGTAINGFIDLLGPYFVVNTASNIIVEYMPNGFGEEIAPFEDGWYPYIQFLGLEFDIFLMVGGIMAGVGLLMYAIYFLFPVFLYAGILLRSFPWTRAAGGSMLALFISFYIIFPAILYAFSVQYFANPAPLSACSAPTLSLASIASIALFGSCVTENAVFSEMTTFISEISYTLLQLFGIVIALLISFDLIEKFGAILGAPSVQAKSLLSKVV